MWPRLDGMRVLELAQPGPFRDELVDLVLAGTKQATAGLLSLDYEAENEALDEVGEHQVVVDGEGEAVAVIEITRVEQHPFVEVPWELADAEGEGFTSIEDFRSGYRRYYSRQGIDLTDDDVFVCVWFRLLGDGERADA